MPSTTRNISSATSLVARGESFVWLTGGALVICLAMIVGLLGWVFYQGLATFWPPPVVALELHDGQPLLGEVTREQAVPLDQLPVGSFDENRRARARTMAEEQHGRVDRLMLRTGNFDLTGTRSRWVYAFDIAQRSEPDWAMVVERREWGRFYGTPTAFRIEGETVAEAPEAIWSRFEQHFPDALDRYEQARQIQRTRIGEANARKQHATLAAAEAQLEYGEGSAPHREALAQLARVEAQVAEAFNRYTTQINELNRENRRYVVVLRTADGVDQEIHLGQIVRMYPANRLGPAEKLGVYASRWGEFLLDDPREANQEGGVFPAIVGTVLMTLIMVILGVPFGVMAALYLREYARAGLAISAVRISINNLAGVPSIVFGVFGLGFFIYLVGGWIDGGPENALGVQLPPRWFFLLLGLAGLAALLAAGLLYFATRHTDAQAVVLRRRLIRFSVGLWLAAGAFGLVLVVFSPFFEGFYRAQLEVADTPTFGKTALIWASFTLALLTLPVVIVATEEALAAVPNSMREGSYACGASKWQTIRRIVLPRAMPGIMTGSILAMARGAGEVAPLMLVGAVKLAPHLPISLDPAEQFGINRSFMHLGFHIYDVGFQSPDSEAARPMVYTTTLLLIFIVFCLNLAAIALRNRLRRKLEGGGF